MATLHYIHDPYCGWCYGAAPLLESAASIEGIEVELHAGGMLTGSRKQRVTPEWRAMVMRFDQHIAAMSGQPFGDEYRNGLLQDLTAIFDSEPPTTAILVADQKGRGLDMLHRIQTGHFIEGRKVSDPAVLEDLAQEIGLDRRQFAEAFAAAASGATNEHIQESRKLLALAGGSGFPTFVLQTGSSAQRLDHGPFLGRPDAWKEMIDGLQKRSAEIPQPANHERN